MNPQDIDFKLKDLTHIYIIESPSQEDIANGISEGYELSERLMQLKITHEYYSVKDRVTFNDAIDQVITSLKPKTNGLGCVHLHFSMHGNSVGIGLTSGETISWQLFADQLYRIANAVGVLRIGGSIYLPIALVFSTCYGIQGVAINAFVRDDQTFYMYVVGPNSPITWRQGLIAFSCYYENSLSNNIDGRRAVEMMNEAANLKDVFEIRLGKNMRWE